jgi:hypothetical protein
VLDLVEVGRKVAEVAGTSGSVPARVHHHLHPSLHPARGVLTSSAFADTDGRPTIPALITDGTIERASVILPRCSGCNSLEEAVTPLYRATAVCHLAANLMEYSWFHYFSEI